MARQNINVNPSIKQFEAYTDFSGGLNSEIANERLKDNEFTIFQNVDIADRGSAKRRTGRKKIAGMSGAAQGVFWYYRKDKAYPDMILAIDGRLYEKLDNSAVSYIPTFDNGVEFTFQSNKPVEAVQVKEDLFIATGTKLVELSHDGTAWSAKTVEPYKPTPTEAVYIGTNGLADTPSAYIQDSVGADLKITGLAPSLAKGAVNVKTNWVAYLEKPEAMNVEYKWEYKEPSATTYLTGKDWNSNNNFDITPSKIGKYTVKSSVRENFLVENADDPWDEVTQTGITTSLDTVNKISGTGSVKITITNDSTSPVVAAAESIPSADFSKYGIVSFWIRSDRPMNASELTFIIDNDTQCTSPIVEITLPALEENQWKRVELTYNKAATGMNGVISIGLGLMSHYNGTYNVWIDDIRLIGSSTIKTYEFPDWEVLATQDEKTKPLDVSGMQKCRKIMLHWNRLILAEDDTNPYYTYISDLQNPRYFPTVNTLDWNTGKQEPISSMVRFQDMLVVFTKTTIQTLVGKSPQDYSRNLIHDGIGCVADRSAKVVNNYIAFLSHEGLYYLKPNPFRLEVMNVQRIDIPVKSQIPIEEGACASVHDGQYWICFPSSKQIFRFYYDNGAWVQDKSTKLNITQFIEYGEDIYNLTTDGSIYKHDPSVYTDDGEAYEMLIETKFMDLSESFNYKKLKKLYVLARHFNDVNVDLFVKVFADAALVLTPDSGEAVVNESTGYVEWVSKTEPNIHFYNTTEFGKWLVGQSPLGNVPLSVQKAAIRGKCRRAKISFTHKQGSACELYGFGLEFKVKKA